MAGADFAGEQSRKGDFEPDIDRQWANDCVGGDRGLLLPQLTYSRLRKASDIRLMRMKLQGHLMANVAAQRADCLLGPFLQTKNLILTGWVLAAGSGVRNEPLLGFVFAAKRKPVKLQINHT